MSDNSFHQTCLIKRVSIAIVEVVRRQGPEKLGGPRQHRSALNGIILAFLLLLLVKVNPYFARLKPRNPIVLFRFLSVRYSFSLTVIT